ncbi:MAG: peptide ABC transporter substrate-binding protein, partial [Lachnospiraceae bacterium]|nr:peptide ABC transporter substrate-binding protein [Lachnospiraceae bacterium]
MKKKVLSLVLAAAMVLSLAACGGTATAEAPAADGAADAATEAATDESAPAAEATVTNADTNILRINLASEPDYLDPALNSSVDGGCLACNSFAGLYTYDESGNLIPDLAD